MTRQSGVMRGTILRTERSAQPGDPLTDRQRAILLAAAEGQTYKEIAETLGITERTVKAHASVIFRKLDAVSMTHAVAIDLRHDEPQRHIFRRLFCVAFGHAVVWGVCPRCRRRALG